MEEKELLDLIRQGESQALEFKRSLATEDKMVEELASFANTSGGTVIVGVRDSGEIIGVSIGANTETNLVNKITDNTDPPLYPTLSIHSISGKSVIVISVEESINKPHLAFGKAFVRVGTVTKQMRRDEYERMLKEKDELPYEMQPVKNATLQDFSQEEVEKYTQLRQTKLGTPLEPYSESLLQKLRAVVDTAGGQAPTVSGILLFGSQPNEFIETRLHYIRCARFKGKEVGTFIDQQDIIGTLRQQIDEAMAFVRRNIRFGWTLEHMPRKKMFEYPLEVIKEAITNAVAHRDLTQNATIRVAIFDDRIEVWSPGKLPVGVTIENLEKACQSRNPNICQRLFEMGYIEAWGLGIDMMNREMAKAGLSKPIYAENGNSFVVTLIGPGDKWMGEISLPPEVTEGLNERQLKAVEYIQETGSIATREYREINNIGKVQAVKELNELVKKVIIKRVGQGRATKYILVND